MEDSESHTSISGGIKTINIFLDTIYLLLLLTCYMLSVDNIPRFMNSWNKFAMEGFAVIMAYMMVCSRLNFFFDDPLNVYRVGSSSL